MADPVAQRNFLALKQKSYAIKFDLEDTGYSAIENIGTGAYGVVCSAINVKTKKKVAIKKIPSIFEQRIIAKRTYREIKILKHFKHDNVISIQEILHPRVDLDQFKDIYIVLDLMESDLHRIIHSTQQLTEEHVRFFTYQILRGLKYIHSANVVHRDLKPSNLLVNENCDLKIGDFGMARGISSNSEEYSMVMTQYVATRWYRAPELMILPKETYTEAVDMWSVGCILAEMIGRKQLFPGNSHVDQIERIIDKLGTPSSDYLKLTSSALITGIIMKKGHVKPTDWKNVYPKASEKALDLLNNMLILDPKKRITVHQALKHPFLEKYHDPDDEPICLPVFNFDFERENLSTQQLKDAITEEIMEYHKPKPKPKMQFNFRPVPKSELIESPPAVKFNFKPVPKSELDKPNVQSQITDTKPMSRDIAQPPTGLEAFSQYRAVKKEEISVPYVGEEKMGQSSSDGSKSDGSFERKHSQLVEDLRSLQALQDTVYTGESLQGFLMAGGKATQNSTDVFKKPEGLPLQVKVKDTAKVMDASIKSSSDVEMCSAKSTARVEGIHGMSVDTKQAEVIDVEMHSAQNKAQDQLKTTDEPQKPVDTKELIRMALLNNKRREQKEALAAKPKPVTALQRQREREERRRQKLEKAKQKQKKAKEKTSKLELTDADKKLLEKWQGMQKSKPSEQGSTTSVGTTRQGSPANVLSESLKKTSLAPGTSSMQPVTDPAIQSTVTQSTDTAGSTVITFPAEPTAIQSLPQTTFPTDNPINLPQDTVVPPLPFGTYAWSGQSLPGAQAELNPSESKLPTYFQAVAKAEDKENMWQSSANPTLAQGMSTDQKPKDMNDSEWLAKLSESPRPLATAVTEIASGQTSVSKAKEEHDMKIITKQLKQSNVEDLTFTNTPKGTGGGYGIGDLDFFMEIVAADKPDSAQLSPSLFKDWQELTGNIDPREFETALNEYMMSPRSSQDFIVALTSPKNKAS